MIDKNGSDDAWIKALLSNDHVIERSRNEHHHIKAIKKWQRENKVADVASNVFWVGEYNPITKTHSVQLVDHVKHAMKAFAYNGTYWLKKAGKEWDKNKKCYVEKKTKEWHQYSKYDRIFPHESIPKKLTDMGSYHALQCKRIIDRSMDKHQFDRNSAKYDVSVVYRSLEYYCLQQGISPPSLNVISFLSPNKRFIKGYIANSLRMQDDQWWERKLVIKYRRDNELKRIKAHKVNNYCSDICLENYQRRLAVGKEHMEGLEAISEHGEVLDMAEIIKRTMANPELRKTELSVRLYGFVDYAQSLGHEVAFYTITAPSKYHANSPKYNGSSPRDTQKYLTTLWAKIRASLKRAGLQVYGFRFVEPHGDATPHWHVSLFMQNEKERNQVTEIIRSYVLEEDIAELKVEGYKHVLAMNVIATKVNALENTFNNLNSRIRLFERDFEGLKASAIGIVEAINQLILMIKQRGLVQGLQGLIAWLEAFIIEVDWLISHKKELNEYLFPLDNAGDELKVFIAAFQTVQSSIDNQFDQWLRVFDKKEKLTGKKTFKNKDRVRFDVEYVKDAAAIVAYIMKYVSKNINGDKVGEDKEIGGDAKDTAKRVVAWASLWGIRQFQQIGGSSVTVYRELRRVKSFDDPALEAARIVADTGNWAGYMEVQGGALCPRNEQAIGVYRDAFIDAFTGKDANTSYGEVKLKMLGLVGAGMGNDVVITRDTQWKIEPKPITEFFADNTISVQPLVKPIKPVTNKQMIDDIVVKGAEATAFCERSESWLFGNNCTEVSIRTADGDLFASGGTVFADDDRDLDDICLEDLLL